MLVSIHEYNEEDYEKVEMDQRYRIVVSGNKKYLYNLSIIDFLTPYCLTKKFELGFKTEELWLVIRKILIFLF